MAQRNLIKTFPDARFLVRLRLWTTERTQVDVDGPYDDVPGNMSVIYDVDPKVIRCPDCNAPALRAKQRGVDRTDLLETGMIPVMLHGTGTAAHPEMARTYHRCANPRNPSPPDAGAPAPGGDAAIEARGPGTRRVTVPHRVGTTNLPDSQDPQVPHEMMCPVCGPGGTCRTCRAEQSRADKARSSNSQDPQ